MAKIDLPFRERQKPVRPHSDSFEFKYEPEKFWKAWLKGHRRHGTDY